ncbi:putative lysine transport system permease protein [Breznakia sp. PF5-3]|nr:putative lysine transport system permease protein [Breznakia sp. PM6-1]MDF9835251.1 putative lysine transport system permease protein [Breznakia sp. PF5-3]MDF9837421.1 putative lysine transport system permease protein [Breznakia sp. PFB2-8]MDF9859357.1 putative lysine transport system permease protein [Breznakia sp. PH5-24]
MKKLTKVLLVCGILFTGFIQLVAAEKKQETFTVGMECNYAPFNWQTNTETESAVAIGSAGYCDGYDVMISQKIADDLDRELVIKKLSWDGLQPALESGEIDAIIAGMTANDERENGIDFTTPYYESEMVMIVRKDSAEEKASSIQDFSGKTVIGQKNTTYDEIIDQIKGVDHATPKATYPEMLLALQNKEVDGITAEMPVAEGVLETNDDLAITTFAKGKGFNVDTSVSIGLKDGTRGTKFFNDVQASLDKISAADRSEMMKLSTKLQPKEGVPTNFFGKVGWIFENNWSLFLYGIQITLLLSIVGTLCGLIIGLILGGVRAVEVDDKDSTLVKGLKRIAHGFVSLYVWIFRGTPMMVQAIFLYSIFRPILHWNALTAGIVIISINTGAYMAEIIRSGIQAVDRGQSEGARSIGMNNTQTMFNIILPQAIKNSFPSIGNQLIVNIKDSSMLNVIGLIELYFQSSSVAGSVMLFTETFFITSIIYLLLTSVATLILNFVEKRLNHVPQNIESEEA